MADQTPAAGGLETNTTTSAVPTQFTTTIPTAAATMETTPTAAVTMEATRTAAATMIHHQVTTPTTMETIPIFDNHQVMAPHTTEEIPRPDTSTITEAIPVQHPATFDSTTSEMDSGETNTMSTSTTSPFPPQNTTVVGKTFWNSETIKALRQTMLSKLPALTARLALLQKEELDIGTSDELSQLPTLKKKLDNLMDSHPDYLNLEERVKLLEKKHVVRTNYTSLQKDVELLQKLDEDEPASLPHNIALVNLVAAVTSSTPILPNENIVAFDQQLQVYLYAELGFMDGFGETYDEEENKDDKTADDQVATDNDYNDFVKLLQNGLGYDKVELLTLQKANENSGDFTIMGKDYCNISKGASNLYA
jgi:hypothetical protein